MNIALTFSKLLVFLLVDIMTAYYNFRSTRWRPETPRSETKKITRTHSISSDWNIRTFWCHFFNPNSYRLVQNPPGDGCTQCEYHKKEIWTQRIQKFLVDTKLTCCHAPEDLLFIVNYRWTLFQCKILSFSGLWINIP